MIKDSRKLHPMLSCNSSIGKLVKKEWSRANGKLMSLIETIRSESFQAVRNILQLQRKSIYYEIYVFVLRTVGGP
jgi:hypothetical protein